MTSFVSASAEKHRPGKGPRADRTTGSPPPHWAKLWLRVQADALRFDPLHYLQGVAWRVRGLKVRSRNRIAGLAGRSPWAYQFWIARREPRIRLATVRRCSGESPQILPVIDCSRGAEHLAETLASLPSDTQPIVVGGPAVPGVRQVRTIGELFDRLDIFGSWLCPVTCGDRLAEGALDAYSAVITASDGATAIYADDDLLDSQGNRMDPHFKPDWNPELFECHDFMTGAAVVNICPEDLEGIDDDNWAKALIGRALQSGGTPVHIPLVLHHRLTRPQPVVPDKPAELRLARTWPLVSVIIPTRNRADLLRKCLEGLTRTQYEPVQVIVVDNESDDPDTLGLFSEIRGGGGHVIRVGGKFNFSRLNNLAVTHAQGELLCFLNNDVEMPDPDWLSLLVRQALRPEIGAVGAQLLYPDGSVQHAGVFTGIGGGAAHGHRFLDKNQGGYFERARLPQRVSAVTGACLTLSKQKFLSVGGFDEENFPVAFNDVDLCLKLNERGWQSFYEARATLIHHESKSRGSDSDRENRARFAQELATLKRKWRTDERPDPFHHPHLSPFCEQFLIAV